MENTKTNHTFKYVFSLGQHKEQEVIWIDFPYNREAVKFLKQNSAAKWSQSMRQWYLRDTNYNREWCNLAPKVVGKEVLTKIDEVNIPEFKKFQTILTLKQFSPNTIRTYSIEFAQLLYILKDYPVQQLTADRLQSYFLYCTKELKLSENQIHSRMNAIKFYFEKVLHKERMFFDIPRPKKPLLLPKYLNTDEIKKLFLAVDNPKHQLILQLGYGMGLRVSEIVNLRIADIDSKSMKVLIQRGKGKKDRYVNLPENVLINLRNYYKEYRPKEFLFEGQQGVQYNIRSAQMVFKNAMNKAGIRKRIGIHGLRHSYATHLLQFGTDIALIQKLLGHNDIRTTLNYTNVTDHSVSNVKSPLDRLPK